MRPSPPDALVTGSPLIAQVVLPIRLGQELSYLVPPEMARRLAPGQRVLVPLKGTRQVGVVVALGGSCDRELRSIEDLVDPYPSITSEVMRLCRWISEYYFAPLGEVLRLASAPPTSLRFELTEKGRGACLLDGLPTQIKNLLATRSLSLAAIARSLGRGLLLTTLLNLLDGGIVALKEPRKARTGAPSVPPPLPPLTPEQATAVRAIIASMGQFSPILLHGVTASGKTRVYLDAIIEAQNRGKTSLYLVPEIAMAIFLEKELAGRLPTCAIHSGLAPLQKSKRIAEIRAGRVALVIGTRSALFAPLPDLGLIVVDEEQDPAYKQEEQVRYHGRDAAVMRAKFAAIPIVMGSATPSIETFHLGATGRYKTLFMRSRIAAKALPAARIVDMRGHGEELLSEELGGEILLRLKKGEQAIVLLNRRGYAPSFVCLECGFVFRCRNCQVSMVYHREQDLYLCHYCGGREVQPETCPECRGGRFHLMGHGTEKVLEEFQTKFAGYCVERFDSDVSTSPSRVRRILEKFAEGEIRVLVGTQMLAKGHHFPNVTLVGVISTDHLLALPDFRAAERVFQLVTQVAGRSGRGALPGEVIVQTRYPSHYAVQGGCSQDYEEFYRQEIRYRETLGYPPFSSLILITCRDRDRTRVARHGRALAALLSQFRAKGAQVHGPVFAPLARIKNRWRVSILLRGDRPAVRETLRRALHHAALKRTRLGDYIIDVDPLDLM